MVKCDELETHTIVEARRPAIPQWRAHVGLRRQEGPNDCLVAVQARGKERLCWLAIISLEAPTRPKCTVPFST